jgi:hypothetical protein
MSTPMGCEPAASRDLRIYVINEAGAAQETLDAAEAEATTIWATGGLRLVWSFPPGPVGVQGRQTVVVVVRRALSPPAITDGADLRTRPHPSLGQIRFGADRRPANLIEVSFRVLMSLVMSGSYLNRPISELPIFAQRHIVGLGLGRVVAHEIGHWLMGSGHTEQGIMRPSFDVRDLVRPKGPRLPATWTTAVSGPLPARPRCELSTPLDSGTRE